MSADKWRAAPAVAAIGNSGITQLAVVERVECLRHLDVVRSYREIVRGTNAPNNNNKIAITRLQSRKGKKHTK